MLAVAGLALFPSVSRTAIPPAGQAITSRSLALYDLSGTRCSVYSNEITVSVLAVYGPVVTPNGTTAAPGGIAHAFAGETVTFVFTLRNAGNADDAFSLYLMYPAPSDFVPVRSAIYLDADMDSLVDMGEMAVSDVGPLGPGEEVLLAIQAQLPPGLTGGETANVNLVARSQADTSSWDRDNVVRIVAREEAEIALALAADRTAAQPGDTIGFALHFTNGGERTAADVTLSALVDLNGAAEGADYVPGSASSTVAGQLRVLRRRHLELGRDRASRRSHQGRSSSGRRSRSRRGGRPVVPRAREGRKSGGGSARDRDRRLRRGATVCRIVSNRTRSPCASGA